MSKKNNSILILFKERKKETPNSYFYERKFSREYDTSIIFISDYLNQSNHKIAENINKLIKKKNISLVLFEGDHISIFNNHFIQLIDNNVKKALFLQDDYMYHYVNRITAAACDFVLTACPLSALKFRELGYKSFFLPVEADGSIFKDYNETKKYDVLFFGRVKNNRSEFIKYLIDNGIKVKQCGPYDSISDTPEKLGKLINQSKIVINFTESDNINKENNPLAHLKYYYQMKGRVCFTGMCGSLCISEYSPSNDLLFNKNEIPFFRNKKDCLNIINTFLTDDAKLIEATKKYRDKCMQYEDSSYIKNIKNFIDQNGKNRNKIEVNIPYWYEFMFFKKNIMLRFRLNKFLSFFKQIFDSIFLTKYKSKLLFPIFIFLSIITSILFLFKFPISKLKI